jgi:hypothetical protein
MRSAESARNFEGFGKLLDRMTEPSADEERCGVERSFWFTLPGVSRGAGVSRECIEARAFQELD